MKTTPELVAKLIFASSQLRWFEKELELESRKDLRDELTGYVLIWQLKVDEVLTEMGMEEFVPLKTLIETINLQHA